ncbi:thioesterase [Pseudohongiella nitratireducens]|uniref:Thioesterase n=1 Tax=Pseudohongiella nitratireducens TaxID=1768907 RepID=A0A916QKU8_9GAMM|nr:hotdog fold thioesterase [Pseudohongiella nitratireducens]MDF1623289.1 hotdog fold thioesterase [Pseudohongiella nitratireducens]GFZ75668.1 thioesterase [Pseudohongiella nitratireducens]|tara:strand:+ start:10756 stop:11184 length:429 start_codon:yes stop_codon:yes gene_type:complete
MSIWKKQPILESLARNAENTAVARLGIEYTEVGDDYLRARMPVDERTVQPFGILHGGASVLLAETLGSVAANHCLIRDNLMAVGLDINANHIRPVPAGQHVYGTATAVHIGATTQVWQINITNDKDKLVCASRITMAIVPRR